MNLKMLHYHVVAQTVSLIKELPIIEHMIAILLTQSVYLDTISMKLQLINKLISIIEDNNLIGYSVMNSFLSSKFELIS